MIKVGITHGDINGIGYEVILKAFSDARLTELCIPIIYGSHKMATFHRKSLEMQQAITFNQIPDTRGAVVNRVNIINCVDENIRIELGESRQEAGEAALKALEKATNDLKRGFIDVLVTAPVNAENIHRDDIKFEGNAKYIESKFAREEEKGLTILTTEQLHVALATEQIPLSVVPASISKERIIELTKILNQSLKRDFRISLPKIAVLALNPTSSGKEEQETIIPAIKELQDEKVLCFGPFASDKFFGSDEYKRYDGVLAMYYDQGYLPFKAITEEEGVEFTAGLPIVHTAPSHGTAYNIAGKNLANEESLRQAIYTAIDIFNNRAFYDEAYANPLQKLYVAKGSDNDELYLPSDEHND